MNIFKEMALSIYSYGSYGKFLQNKKGKVFGFGTLLILFYFMITMFIPSLIQMVAPNGVLHTIVENIPEFELKDGYLQVEDTFEYDEGGVYVDIDTDPEWVFYSADEMIPYLNDYTDAILIDSEKMIVKSNGQVQELKFSDIEGEFTRYDLLQFVPWIYVIYVICMIFFYLWEAALFFLGVFFVAALGMIVASVMKVNLTFGQIYLISVYSRTLPLIIKAVLSFLPVHVPFFWLVNFGLSVFILGMAMRKLQDQAQPPQQQTDYHMPQY